MCVRTKNRVVSPLLISCAVNGSSASCDMSNQVSIFMVLAIDLYVIRTGKYGDLLRKGKYGILFLRFFFRPEK